MSKVNTDKLVHLFLEKARSAGKLSAAQTYADAALETIRLSQCQESTVRLLDAPISGTIIPVIKVLREHLQLGLKEAKDLAESAPANVFTGNAADAKKLANALGVAGASVRLEE